MLILVDIMNKNNIQISNEYDWNFAPEQEIWQGSLDRLYFFNFSTSNIFAKEIQKEYVHLIDASTINKPIS